ncbi:MAG: T9SS type A sorting domain-containing protein [Bacteroidales bacterium]|nr:T9SS type A sorting domain-containing protein [Bacteroidales bacterium]MCF8387684.1 T9SS type A sorting domain-containing protein [Bacteroidales bacterium]MCF8398765.1 T9SS type A sorting domain-containing protein [Bacteroidales bacterium]
MKKTLLFALFLMLTIGLSAQSFELTYNGTVIDNGENFTLYIEPLGPEEVLDNIHVKNIGDNSMDILAKKNVITAVEESMNTFCWADICYPPFTIVSTDYKTLGPGESATDFSAHFTPSENLGTSEINYVFFDMNNTSDTFYINVKFITQQTIASSFEMRYEGELIENGEEFLVEGDPDESQLDVENFDIKNISANTIEVLAKKNVISEVPETTNTFCWADQCYSPTTIVSTQSKTLASGESATDFSAHYQPAGTEGITEINYIIFNADNPQDSIYINVSFKTSPEGLQEEMLAEKISAAYPNPADNEVFFDLSQELFPAGMKLIVHNIVGEVVKTIHISGKSGQLSLNVSDLNSGVYMYSVLIDEKIIKSSKLIINH